MNPTDPLAQLHPLREPAAIGWWPLAPGWWILLALLLAAITLLVWLALRQYRRNAYRRQGQVVLAQIHSQWLADEDALGCLTQANALLKAVALRAYPRRDIAGISGQCWQSFLNQSGGNFQLAPLQAQYRHTEEAVDVEQHLQNCARWIKHHRVTS